MSSFDFSSNSVQIKLAGKKVDLRLATIADLKKIEAELKAADGDDEKALEAIFVILDRHGLKREDAESLPFAHLQKILGIIKDPN